MRQISVVAAAEQLSSLAEQTASESVMLTTESGPVAVLVSFPEFQALQIARSLAKDPESLVAIRAAYERARTGKFETFEKLADVLEDMNT
jgi:PHD/YefM family antitoxin component YafN of YafNO toxin-antitoxin module